MAAPTSEDLLRLMVELERDEQRRHALASSYDIFLAAQQDGLTDSQDEVARWMQELWEDGLIKFKTRNLGTDRPLEWPWDGASVQELHYWRIAAPGRQLAAATGRAADRGPDDVSASHLDSLSQAVLMAVARLTSERYDETDGPNLQKELLRAGQPFEPVQLYNLLKRLQREGYLKVYFGGGMSLDGTRHLSLTERGRTSAARPDPLLRMHSEMRRVVASDAFAESFPSAFAFWAEAEHLLWSAEADRQLTTIGHKVREAAQAFTSALVEEHGVRDAEPNPAQVERRLGAVIAKCRHRLGESRAGLLEALGDLWEANNRLIQRQEHGASKEGAALTWDDARRIVFTTMFVMFEVAATLEDLEPPPVAHLEGGRSRPMR